MTDREQNRKCFYSFLRPKVAKAAFVPPSTPPRHRVPPATDPAPMNRAARRAAARRKPR